MVDRPVPDRSAADSRQLPYETYPQASFTAAGLVVAAIIMAALYFGRDILVPLALATLLCFVLTPPLQWLRRLGLPRVLSVISVVGAAFLAIGIIGFVVGGQLVQLANDLPSYQHNIQTKLDSLKSNVPGAGVIERVTDTVRSIGNELARPEPEGGASATTPAETKPIPVIVEPGPLRPLEFLQSFIGPILTPLATAGLVVLFVVFILLEREELRDRFIALVSAGDVQRSTEAIMEAGVRVSRYLLMQLIVNVTFGIAIGVGLWAIGVPNAVLWGILSAVLRFIPYLGPWIAALLPITIAFASDPGWTMVILAILLFVIIELASNNIMEPMLYGSTTGLSSFAIILAAIFWTLLWGPIGLLLATPLTVCLVVVGRYVPRLEFLGVLLGSAPVLSPSERLYQRLLAGNIEEALELAEEALEASPTATFVDDVAIPALKLAERDRERGANAILRRNIVEGVAALMDEVEHELDGKAERPAARPSARLRIMCIGGRTELDQAAAAMLAHHFTGLGHEAECKAPIAISPAMIGQLDLDDADVVCLAYLERNPERQARYASRRIARRDPGAVRLICCFGLDDGQAAAAALETQLGSQTFVATSLSGAERALANVKPDAEPDEAPAETATVGDVLEKAKEKRLDAGAGHAFESLADRLQPLLGDSLLLVALLDKPDPEGQSEDDTQKPPSQSASIAHIVRERSDDEVTPLVVKDVAADPVLAKNEFLLEKGVRFFAAAPIRSGSGQFVGAVCVLDPNERDLTPAQITELERAAEQVGREMSEEAESMPKSSTAPASRASAAAAR